MKLGPVGCSETSAPTYFPMLTAWKTKDLNFSKLKNYVGNTVKGIQGHKPTLFSTQFSFTFFCQENIVTWQSTNRMQQRTAVISDAVCVIRQCRDW
jgi:hypothetical protein